MIDLPRICARRQLMQEVVRLVEEVETKIGPVKVEDSA